MRSSASTTPICGGSSLSAQPSRRPSEEGCEPVGCALEVVILFRSPASVVADRKHARLRQRVRDSVTVDFDQTLVADSEVMRDLVEDDASHLTAKQLRVLSAEPPERAAVDRDLVRQHSAVVTAASG